MLRTTQTENGRVAGLPGTDARITVYKGIPFAADTSGENRWRPPQPAKDWEGTRECYAFGPIPMQKTPGEDPNAFYSKEWHVDPEVPMGEDCLRANIWTSAKTGKEKMPVMVWIFGGGYKEGYPFEMEFDGERIASRGVVLVSIGYRLNCFGFLCHPEITAENPDAPANLGLLDQRYGIEWVKRNIANFGGDPENITIFGQSAGGGSVTYHLCAPGNDGLFQKAVVQSFGGITPVFPPSAFPKNKTLREAEEIGRRFFEESLGVKSLAEARKLDGKWILQKFLETGLWLEVVIDDKYVTGEFSDAILDGKMMRVPMIVGHNTGESVSAPDRFGPMDSLKKEHITLEDIQDWLNRNMGKYGAEYREICRKTAADERIESLNDALALNASELRVGLLGKVCQDQNRPIYTYAFGPTIPGDDAGAFHSCDLWFEFETLMKCWRPFDGHHYDLARKMCNYWTNFAKTGDPNGKDADGTPMPQWDPYTEVPARMEFFDQIHLRKGDLSPQMQFLYEINLRELKNRKQEE